MPSESSPSQLLVDLAGALANGTVRVVDLTMPLGPETPILPLPDSWPDSPPFTISVISAYDERGPAWYWNAFQIALQHLEDRYSAQWPHQVLGYRTPGEHLASRNVS